MNVPFTLAKPELDKAYDASKVEDGIYARWEKSGYFDPDKLPGGKKFLEDYNKQGYSNPPEAYGPFAYAAAELLMDAIEKVGPDRKKIIKELANVKDRDSIVGKITFDDHGQNTVPAITKYVVQDGKWVTWEDSEYASGKRKLTTGK